MTSTGLLATPQNTDGVSTLVYTVVRRTDLLVCLATVDPAGEDPGALAEVAG
jgi:hypothetical protein